MNVSEDMIKLTKVESQYPHREREVWVNRRDIFNITQMELKSHKNELIASAFVTITRWQETHEFHTKELAVDILKLMGREE